MTQLTLPYDPVWLRLDEQPKGYCYKTPSGYKLYCLGNEGEYLVAFRPMDVAQFISFCKAYERAVEGYDVVEEHGEESDYTEDMVTTRAVALMMTCDDEWWISWSDDVSKDTFAMVLNRW